MTVDGPTAMEMCGLIQQMEDEEDEVIPLPAMGVEEARKLAEFLRMCEDREVRERVKNLELVDYSWSQLDEELMAFANGFEDCEGVVQMIGAAEYVDCQPLVYLMSWRYAREARDAFFPRGEDEQ